MFSLRADRKKNIRVRAKKADPMAEQVKKVMKEADQGLILMVRG